MGEIPIPTPPFCCELKSAVNKEAERKKKKREREETRRRERQERRK